jgi:hypothetical protein
MRALPTSRSPFALGYKGLASVVIAEANVTTAGGVVRVPYFGLDGREVNAKLFSLKTGRSWWEKRGVGVLPFGLERLPDPDFAERFALVLAEGEADALAVRGSVGLRDDWSVRVLGLPGASTWRSEFGLLVRRFPVVYVVGDGDAPGRRMMDAVLADVSWARPVRMPDGEDARSIIQGADGDEAFRRLLDEADQGAEYAYALTEAETPRDFVRTLAGGDGRVI